MNGQISTKEIKNKRMSRPVYTLRRRVMGLIYEARRVVNLPRIEVRIVDNIDGVNAAAELNGNRIWVTEEAASNMPIDDLRRTVYHEIIHAVLGVNHVEKCPMMHYHSLVTLTKRQADFYLTHYFLKYSKK